MVDDSLNLGNSVVKAVHQSNSQQKQDFSRKANIRRLLIGCSLWVVGWLCNRTVENKKEMNKCY